MSQQFRISRAPWGLGYELRFADIGSGENIALAEPATLRMRKDGDEPSKPMLEMLKEDALQSLMDELWLAGIRPKDIGTAGHLAATQAHLNDFRAIVAKTLDVKL